MQCFTVTDSPPFFFNQSGHVVMFRGMMELFDNDDQVAVVLAHEMSHAILEHSVSMKSWIIICLGS